MCVHAGVAMGTGVGASRRGSGLGRVGAWASAWASGSEFLFLFFSIWLLVFSFQFSVF